jgi:fragile X mental retardation protein
LRQEKQEIDQQLRAIQGSGMGSMQNFPMSRRSDRAYSNDYDSRSNRGSSRGGRGSNRGRNSMGAGSGNPRYSNRRERGDDTEEEFHRGSSYSNSNKFQGGRGSTRGNDRGNYSQLNKGKGDFRRGGPKEEQSHREHASSIDRGEYHGLSMFE